MNTFATTVSTGFGSTPAARILVVGHSQSCRSIFASVLAMSGHEVATAVDGVEALQRCATESFDLIVTDWKMPLLNGGSLVLALRAKGIDTPAIILSADFAHSLLPATVASEVFASLEMPIYPPQLLSAVAAALRPGSHPPQLSAAST